MRSASTRFATFGLATATLIAASLSTLGCGADDKNKDKGPITGASNDWVTMGYDLGSTYHNTKETTLTKENVGTLHQKWEAPILNYGTPVVVGDVVYSGGSDGIYALDANTGAQIWKYEPMTVQDPTQPPGLDSVSSSLAYENGILYFNSSLGMVRALDVTTNPPTLKWEVPAHDGEGSAGFSSAIVVGDHVLIGNSIFDQPTTPPYRGGVSSYRKSDGFREWRAYTADPAEDGCSVWGTVSVDAAAQLVYAPVGNNYTVAGPGSDSIQAFNIGDGTLKWKSQVTTDDIYNLTAPLSGRDYDFGANPVVFDYNGKKLVAGAAKSGIIHVWDRLAGGTPTSRTLGGASAFAGGVFQGLAFDGEHLIVVSNGATSSAPGGEPTNGDFGQSTSVLFALVPDTLEIVWERQLGSLVYSPITIANGIGFLGVNTWLEAFDTATGDVLFKERMPIPEGLTVPGTIASGVTISSGRVFFGSGMNWIGAHADGTLRSFALP